MEAALAEIELVVSSDAERDFATEQLRCAYADLRALQSFPDDRHALADAVERIGTALEELGAHPAHDGWEGPPALVPSVEEWDRADRERRWDEDHFTTFPYCGIEEAGR